MEHNIDLEVFIQLVRAHPYLYNKGDKYHKDVLKKENAWKAISETLNTTGNFFYFVFLQNYKSSCKLESFKIHKMKQTLAIP